MSTKRRLNVHIIGPTFGLEGVFPEYGYIPWTDETIHNAPTIDIACFTGGQDINPKLYGQKPLSNVHYSNARDLKEIASYHKYKGIPKLGICRGAQLINVLNGGSLYQHVDNHYNGHHEVIDKKTGEVILVCSLHHQLMIPSKNSELIAWAQRSKKRFDQHGEYERQEDDVDPEVLFIKEDKALLFQAHPEFGPKSCTDYFFNLVERYIL